MMNQDWDKVQGMLKQVLERGGKEVEDLKGSIISTITDEMTKQVNEHARQSADGFTVAVFGKDYSAKTKEELVKNLIAVHFNVNI